MLISIKKHLARQLEQFNFDMVYEEYREFTKQCSTSGKTINLFYVKPVAHKAFERLLELNMIKYVDGITAKVPKDHRMVTSLFTRDMIEDAVAKNSEGAPPVVLKW